MCRKSEIRANLERCALSFQFGFSERDGKRLISHSCLICPLSGRASIIVRLVPPRAHASSPLGFSIGGQMHV